MENVIYRGVIKEARDTPSGETPDCIFVTLESNGFAIWRSNHDEDKLIRYLPFIVGRDAAIEQGVEEKWNNVAGDIQF